MKLSQSLRKQLKTPLGILVPDNQVTKENVLKYLPENPFLITVGDATTEKMIHFEIIPSLQIIDKKEKRLPRNAPPEELITTNLYCDNPPGEISNQSIEIIKKAFQSKPPVRINITGEEDLLVIPVCIYAPENSVVLYGQPNEGLVIVQITSSIRKKTQLILDSMN